MNPNTGRSSIFAIVGAYLIYMAYGMLKDLINKVPTTMPLFLLILFIALFTGIGIALLIFAWKVWKKGKEDSDRNPLELEEKDPSESSGENLRKE